MRFWGWNDTRSLGGISLEQIVTEWGLGKTDKSTFRYFNCDPDGHAFCRYPTDKTRDICFGCGHAQRC